MKAGIIFPQDLRDPVAVRDFVQAIEALGFSHLGFPDHVFGANPASHKLDGPYTHKSFFHECFSAMAYVAGITQRLGLVSNVLILPQRQTGMVAKQAAAIDVLSGGRLRLGVGIGWNQVEYEVLGMDFHNRGKRVEEQVALLRRLWCEELVTFEGQWHTVVAAGINPLPVQRPIPIWFGGWSDPMLERIARTGDGWIAACTYEGLGAKCLDKIRKHCDATGRDLREIGVQAMVNLNKSNVFARNGQKPGAEELRSCDEWAHEARLWKSAGATHIDCFTMYGNLPSPEPHIELARRFKEVIDSL